MSYKISDVVAMRMVQIFQEAVIFGIDGADLLRQVRLIVDDTEPDTMTLDPAYLEEVERNFEKYLKEAEEKSAEMKKQSASLSIPEWALADIEIKPS